MPSSTHASFSFSLPPPTQTPLLSLSNPTPTPLLSLSPLSMDHGAQAILAAIASFFQHRKYTKTRNNQIQTRNPSPNPNSFLSHSVDASWPPNLKISMEELARATNNFSPHLIVGNGSFGLVYKAFLSTGAVVAVKKLSPDAFQGFREFAAEMETLSRLCHHNIVKILGYGASGPERLLVYEFAEKGNLDQWLHEPSSSPHPTDDVSAKLRFALSWETRVNIIRGVAHGLCYLHGLEKPIIHRDIKASNILLDSDFQAHIADFGLARRMDSSHTHVSTLSAGTIGYMPPEYRNGSNVANPKVDVYSFGVLMMETVSGRRPDLAVKLDQEDIGLVNWARTMEERKTEMELLDVNILTRGEVDQKIIINKRQGVKEQSVKEYVSIACKCTAELQRDRPEMPEVVELLDSIFL